MNPLKGINQDISPNELPDGFYSFAKNILLSSTFNAVENEQGFLASNINSNGSYKTLYDLGLRPVGVISTTKFEVFWLTNNTRSVIGTYNEDLDTFTIVYDDSTKPKLNLNLLYPVKSVWRENFLGEIYVAWTDRLNKPKILNIQKASLVDNEKDLLLFSEFTPPTIEFNIESGGSLIAGTYYGYIQYETTDGKVTDYSLASYPVYIGPDPQTAGVFDFFGSNSISTAKRILFKISDVDISYDKINLAVQRINHGNNVKDFVKVTTLSISGRDYIEIPYSGSENVTTLTSDDVLIKAPAYSVAQTITTLNSQLFLGNLKTESEINIQKYVNNWKVKWVYDEVSYPSTTSNLSKYSQPKSFAHDEVYALYAIIEFNSGKTSQAFVLPGRDYSTVTVGSKTFNENAVIKATDNLPTEVGYIGDTDYLTEDFSLNTGDVKYFQTRDTCSWDGVSGTMGYWENENEEYPNNSDWEIWDNTGNIGTLANKKVRHHKFPSNSFIKETIYPSDDTYGMTKIDRLGIKLQDVYLPADILSQVSKITICHAKRDFNNSLVVSQDKTSFMGFILTQTDQDPVDGNYDDSVAAWDLWGTLPFASVLTKYYNADADAKLRRFSPFDVDGYPYTGASGSLPDFPDYFRLKLHSPEILNLSPNLGSTYLKLNYRVEKTADTTFSGALDTNANFQVSAISVDCTSGTSGSSTSVSEDKKILKVLNSRYTVPNLTNYPVGSNPHTECLLYAEQGAIVDITKSRFDFSGSGDNLDFQELKANLEYPDFYPFPYIESDATVKDFYYHYNLNKYYSNVYTSFLDQDLVVVESLEYTVANTKEIYNADVFLDLYSYNCFTGMPSDSDDSNQVVNDSILSVRTVHTIFIETSLNSGLRYTTDISNKFYKGDRSYLLDSTLPFAGNNLLINLDFNQINEQISNTIFEDSTKSTDSFPHRIVKSLPITSESKVQQWTQFLPLDYYEIDKSKGYITNLQGVVDKLLIHTQRSLFTTRDKARLGTDIGQVNLTSGDLFDFAPIEILPTQNGYTGTQHMFSCQLLNEGYFWVDALSGKVFIYDGTSLPKELNTQGLFNFFANNLGQFEDSPFNSNGISVINDVRYNRILLSVKKGNNNYTLSYLEDLNQGQGGWVSFHDYNADYLFSSRKNTYSFKDGKLYRHNNPLNRGNFYSSQKFSSFIEIPMNSQNVVSSSGGKRVFNNDSIYLNSVVWNTDMSSSDGVFDPNKTISHLVVRNQFQHSSRIILDYSNLNITTDSNSRNAETRWYCNSFRDLVANKNLPFIQDIFNNFDEISSNIDPTKPWFEQEQFNNRWFIIRLEYDNEGDYKMVLHSIDINKTDSYR